MNARQGDPAWKEWNSHMIGMLEQIKRKAKPLVGMMPSANMRDRVRKIYDLAKELQDDLDRKGG